MPEKCECVSCHACGGTGTLWFSLSGNCLGKHRLDDLSTPDVCEMCDGRGVTETCDYCRDEIEREAEDYV